MPMTSTFTMRYEGPPACVDCQRAGVPVCVHVGFNAEAWDGSVGRVVERAPGLDMAYQHTVTGYDISADRKTLTVTVATERPHMTDLARHLSLRSDRAGKAAIRAIHHETGDKLEEGWYDAPLRVGQAVCIDRDVYHVVTVEHPNRNPEGIAAEVDIQEARLAPVPTETIHVASAG